VCGGQLVQRPDDNPDAIRDRLADYHGKTRPILELFKKKELVVAVDGTRPAKEIQADIRSQLGLPQSV
jgi:adenylate kinase